MGIENPAPLMSELLNEIDASEAGDSEKMFIAASCTPPNSALNGASRGY